MIQKLRFYLLKIAYPVLKFLERLTPPEPLATAEFYYLVRERIQPGDVLLSMELSHKFANKLIPGFWSHAAIYCGKTKHSEETVIEAVGKGVGAVPLVKWILLKDSIAVLRFNDTTPEIQRAAAEEALKHIGEPYDYELSSGNAAWYCAELVYYAHAKAREWLKMAFTFKMKPTWGVDTVTPDDFHYAVDKLNVVASYDAPNR